MERMETKEEPIIKRNHYYRVKRSYSYLEFGRVYYSDQDKYLCVDGEQYGMYINNEDARKCFEEVKYKDVEKGKWYECRKTHNGFQEGEFYYCDENGFLVIKKPIGIMDSFNFSEILD